MCAERPGHASRAGSKARWRPRTTSSRQYSGCRPSRPRRYHPRSLPRRHQTAQRCGTKRDSDNERSEDRMASTVKQYLIDRLAELGGQHMFGVPGNYNAEFLLAAVNSGRLKWIGTTNEMEAGYAADAY